MHERCFGCKSYSDKIGVLIAQLGTPTAPTAAALRPYLRQFLSDPRVIEVNRFLWWTILNGAVLVTRPKRSARLYKRIWGSEGSPLMTITVQQTNELRTKLQALDASVEVEFGMRYGKPSLELAIEKLFSRGVSKVLLFPMYPHYAGATTASTYDAVFPAILKRRWVPTLRVAEPYYRNERYIDALAATINSSLKSWDDKPERLVLSYHGIPRKYVDKGDPYCCQCTETTRALVPRLEIAPEKVIHTYQSRFGKDPWLEPYTDVTIEKLAKEGIRKIAVAAPGFTADCLETLDELGNEARHLFEEHGGQRFLNIPCLNAQAPWVEAMTDIVVQELGSWLAPERQLPCVSCPMASAGNA